MVELGQDFKSSEPGLKEYVQANESDNLLEARKDSISSLNYKLALVRLSNIAASRGIARGKFKDSIDALLADEADVKANIAWGTDSELCDDAIALGILDAMRRKHGERVQGLRLYGQKHALANDRALQSAVIAHFIGLE